MRAALGILLLLLLIFCVGCESYTLDVTPQSLWDTPLPTPVLLDRVETYAEKPFNNLRTCSSFYAFEPGSRTTLPDELPEISHHTVRVYIDGNRIHDWFYVTMGWFDHTICFHHPLDGDGLHVADVAFSTSSGNENQYMWAFSIDMDASGNPMVSYPVSLQH